MARSSTYLNFARSTEEVFNYYARIFGKPVSNVSRFGDFNIPGAPPMDPADKSLIMHIEVEITGGHLLMGTDAPESMGFSVTQGNQMHLMVEPDSRAEADRLFTALSAGGTITMPIQEMFWGAYYGSCKDKYGVQWMVSTNGK